MRALIQRVTEGKVVIDKKIYSQIGKGYVIFLGIFEDDVEGDMPQLLSKILNLRIMSDSAGKMNTSILDIKGEILLVSQFTLCADTSQGRRPSFLKAKKPVEAEKLYYRFIEELQKSGLPIKTGKFGALMNVVIHNDGPVTILLDTRGNS